MGAEPEKGTFQYRKSLKDAAASAGSKFDLVDNYLNRPVAALIVRAVYKTPVTPNGLTYASLVLGLLGAFFFTRGTYLYFILGGVFTQVSSVVDGADGMLARAKNMCSDYGSYLDLFFDRIIDFSLFVCIAVGAHVYYDDPNLLFIGVLSSGLYLLQVNLFYLLKSYLQVTRKGDTGGLRAIIMWLVLIFAVINRLDIVVYLGAVGWGGAVVGRLVHFILLGKKKSGAEREP
jgi:phosphatidylglycerophosphate synthase